MKRIALSLGALSIFFLTAPSQPRQRVGARIHLFAPPEAFTAGEAFHIAHGWTFGPKIKHIGLYDFDLEVDGTFRDEDFVEYVGVDTSDPPADPDHTRFWVHNFPEGMPSGFHTFTGHWFAPCKDTPGPCENSSDRVEALTLEVTVTFEEP